MDFENIEDDWKKEAPHLASLQRLNPFTVPENYFETLPEEVESRIVLETLSIQPNWEVPQGYFDNLGADIETRIAVDRLKSLVSNDGFAVPVNYFEDLQLKTIAKTKASGKVRFLQSNVYRYAAAACVTIVAGAALWLNLGKHPSEQQQLAKISDQEIMNYLQLHADATDLTTLVENSADPTLGTEAHELSTEELEDYLSTTL